VFNHYHFEKQADPNAEFVNKLIEFGHPVVSIALTDNYDLGREMFRWEMITAVASTLLFVNPFDQPDVQSAKDNTKKFITKLEETGKLPSRKVSYKEECLRFLHNGTNINGTEIFKDFFQFIKPGDFICLLAYMNETSEHSKHLEEIASALETKFHVPVTVGYGPRYLHSTGQFHKGGPNRGFFIELISEGMAEVPLPGRGYGFSEFIVAQALGDYDSLVTQGRKVLRVDVGKNRKKGLLTLSNTIQRSLLS
jgi:transaldolase/glucose-6-phosphate isomerase